MINKLKGFICGVIFTALLGGAVVSASPVAREIFFGVGVMFNGAPVSFAADSQPFIMNGRTYLPVRAIADIVGLQVDFFDGIVMLTSPDAVVPPPVPDAVPEIPLTMPLPYPYNPVFNLPQHWTESAGSHPHDFTATSPLGVTVSISTHEITPEEAAVFVDQMVLHSEEMGMSINRNLPPVTIVRDTWETFQTTMDMGIPDVAVNVYGHYFINIQDGIARVITIIRPDIGEPLEEIMQLFT
ncbi:MAG: copper amine oxidase N-terminal domain-containing protein [Defluviitaleaceae bacterium]|nr:copper amine oxidase N-terminal domain-containing protein [Defluviitaleaceae bacterium]MCL2262054.1 copper amine oxidase N-terminal domain-containing protein [Defluviitaleaceae bacterium]